MICDERKRETESKRAETARWRARGGKARCDDKLVIIVKRDVVSDEGASSSGRCTTCIMEPSHGVIVDSRTTGRETVHSREDSGRSWEKLTRSLARSLAGLA